MKNFTARNVQLALIATIFGLVTVVEGSLLKYYTDIVGLRPTIYGKVFSVIGVITVINYIWGGIFTDMKARYIAILRFTPPFTALMGISLLFIQPTWSDPVLYAVIFGIMFFYEIGKMLYWTNANVFMLNVITSSEERTAVSAIKSYIAFLPSGISSYMPILLLTGDLPRKTIMIIYIACVIVGVILTELALKGMRSDMVARAPGEKPLNFSDLWCTLKTFFSSWKYVSIFMSLVLLAGTSFIYYPGYLYFMDNVLNVSGIKAIIPDVAGAVVQVGVYAFLVTLVKRFGTRDTLRLALFITVLCYIGLSFTSNYFVAAVLYALIMVGLAAYWGLLQPIAGLIADMDEIETGKRKMGTYWGIINLLFGPASSLMMLLFTTLLEKVGYDGSVKVQTPETAVSLRLIIAWIPAVFFGITLIPLSLFPLNRQKERELNQAIEARHLSKKEDV